MKKLLCIVLILPFATHPVLATTVGVKNIIARIDIKGLEPYAAPSYTVPQLLLGLLLVVGLGILVVIFTIKLVGEIRG